MESKMDALLRVVRKSPNVTKDQGKIKHSKIPEGWGDVSEPVVEGVTFYLKYIGSTLVEELHSDQTYGDGISAKAVHTITAMAKSAGKKLRKTALTVSPKGIRTVDMTTKQVMFDISIYRISFCTADKNHDHVFAYIARNTTNETMECHAFLCAKIKIAQAVTLTVSQAFTIAQEKWQANKKLKKAMKDAAKKEKIQSQEIVFKKSNDSSINSAPLISFTSTPSPPMTPEISTDISPLKSQSIGHRKNWQSFDDTDDDIDEMFSRLAENRIKKMPSFGTDLKEDDLEDGVQKYMAGSACYEAFSRTMSVDDLLSL
ncbi:low density lipoprotein receptor adapter protein 1-A-like [Physella acuta]|uniref:low density lipoprotein receptor adapter protein 1-A-like n=1 Tax=Physella acuta TaxID=109671 RepID=UPI0027DD480C|nr:low density lipoprotein receptor adapter protein 1-A-like [Physella acuta]